MGAVAVLAVLLSAVASIGGPTVYPEWQYDDYRELDSVASVSGSLELVDVGGTMYVHAHSLGPGTITFEDGGVRGVDVLRAVLDVFLITGQSNAAYYTEGGDATVDPSTASPVPAPGTAYYYGFPDRYDMLTDGTPQFLSMTASDGSAAIGDKAPPWASTYYGSTGHKTYWICGAVSGTTVSQFVPGSGDVWEYMSEVVPSAMEAIDRELYRPVIKGYMWIQGEYDNSTDVEEYKSDFLAMHEAILSSELGGCDFDHCFISTVRYGNSVTAQKELAAEFDTVSICTEISSTFTQNNGLLGDGVHYSQAGDNIIGAALGDCCAAFYIAQASSEGPVDVLVSLVPVLLAVSGMAFVALVLITRRY